MDGEASPAAADVEHAHSRLELELAADELELRSLRVLERLRSLLEQGAAVGHRLVEEESEELVRDVVVVAHRFRIASLRVAPPAGAKLSCRWLWQPIESRRAQGGAAEAKPLEHPELGRLPPSEQRDDAVEVVHVDVPADIRAPQSDLARRAQEMAERPRRLDRHR